MITATAAVVAADAAAVEVESQMSKQVMLRQNGSLMIRLYPFAEQFYFMTVGDTM